MKNPVSKQTQVVWIGECSEDTLYLYLDIKILYIMMIHLYFYFGTGCFGLSGPEPVLSWSL